MSGTLESCKETTSEESACVKSVSAGEGCFHESGELEGLELGAVGKR